MKRRRFSYKQMDTAITHLSLEAMQAMTSDIDFIAPYSYNFELWLYAKRGSKILITDNPKKVEQMFPNLDWFSTALPQIIVQHKMGCLSPSISEKLTYYSH